MTEEHLRSDEVASLMAAGLTEYEAKAYRAMLDQDLVSASDVTRMSDVPQGRVYNVINNLARKGFCEVVPGVQKRFRAVSPKSAIGCVVEQQREKQERILEAAEKLETRYTNKQENASCLDYLQILTSRQSQMNKYLEFQRGLESRLMSFNKKPYATNTKLSEVIQMAVPLAEKLSRGVVVRAIYEADDEDYLVEWLDYFESIGEEVRISEKLPIKMLIADHSKVMVSLRNDGAGAFKVSSMVIEHSDLTTALVELFEYHWEKSMTLEEYKRSRNCGDTV